MVESDWMFHMILSELLFVITVVWRLITYHCIKKHPKAPNIGAQITRITPYDLWRHEMQGSFRVHFLLTWIQDAGVAQIT
mgnify:CR=1 FL=1